VGSLDDLERISRIQRGMWVAAASPRPAVGTTPHEIIHTHDKLVVRYYPRHPDAPAGALPVVIVPSLINRAWICDLEPGRSLVDGLARHGHDVYLVDWGVPAEEDADEDVGYHLLVLLHNSIRRIARHAQRPAVHLFGYCMGGTLAIMYTALRPALVRSLCTLAAPVRFCEGGRFRELVAPLDVDQAFPPGSLVPVEMMRPAFQLLDPVGSVTKFEAVEQASHDEASLRRTMVRERWLEENVPVSGAFAREFIRHTYQQDVLLEGSWTIRGEPVDLRKISIPVRVVACRRDFVAPLASVAPLAEILPQATLEVLETGHIGVVVGAAGPRQFYPLLDQFFRETAP
jgi:polyhydroxyalkanoate synthase